MILRLLELEKSVLGCWQGYSCGPVNNWKLCHSPSWSQFLNASRTVWTAGPAVDRPVCLPTSSHFPSGTLSMIMIRKTRKWNGNSCCTCWSWTGFHQYVQACICATPIGNHPRFCLFLNEPLYLCDYLKSRGIEAFRYYVFWKQILSPFIFENMGTFLRVCWGGSRF